MFSSYPSLLSSDIPHFPETEALLVAGGDGRLSLDALTGRNRYGCAPRPDADLLDFASATASVVSAQGYAAAEALRRRLGADLEGRAAQRHWLQECVRIQEAIADLLGVAAVPGLRTLLSPSGTDLHALALAYVRPGPSGVAMLLPDAVETGSGVPAILTQSSAALARSGLQLHTVGLRLPDGRLRTEADLAQAWEFQAEEALRTGKNLLVIVLDVSKTGLLAPSPIWVLDLMQRHPGRVSVLVDACQARIAGSSLSAWLSAGAMVAVTGSKFLAGPSFSGALFLPPTGHEGPPAEMAVPNWGLLLRWQAALAELPAFVALAPPQVASCLSCFGQWLVQRLVHAPQLALLPASGINRLALMAPPSWDQYPSIFPLRLMRATETGDEGLRYLIPDEVAQVYRLMMQDLSQSADWANEPSASVRVRLGQPVPCHNPDGSPGAVLRLCLSSRQVVAAQSEQGMAQLLSQADVVLNKLCALLKMPGTLLVLPR